MYGDITFLCLICIFNIKFTVIEGQGKGLEGTGAGGAWGELSRAVKAEREREREQMDGLNLIGCWMVAV
jgi:hypothetical protein